MRMRWTICWIRVTTRSRWSTGAWKSSSRGKVSNRRIAKPPEWLWRAQPDSARTCSTLSLMSGIVRTELV